MATTAQGSDRPRDRPRSFRDCRSRLGFGVLLLPLAGAAVVHLWWLPKHGINGWTGEPKDKYYELIGHKRE